MSHSEDTVDEAEDGFDQYVDTAMDGDCTYKGNDATLVELAAQMKGAGPHGVPRSRSRMNAIRKGRWPRPHVGPVSPMLTCLLIARLCLSRLVAVGGVDIKDRTYRARIYRMCFVGQEAVDWLVKTLRLDSREEAVLLGTSRSISVHISEMACARRRSRWRRRNLSC